MNVRFVLRAYWAGRDEPVTACARRMVRLVQRLEEAGLGRSGWFTPDPVDPEGPPVPLPAESHEQTAALFQRFDPDDPEGTAGLTLFHRDEGSVAMSVTFARPGSAAPSVLWLVLPPIADEPQDYYRPDAMETMFWAVVDKLEPDWASFACDPMIFVQNAGFADPAAGWLSYARTSRAVAGPPAPGVRVVPKAAGIGVLTAEQPLETTPEQIHAADAIVTETCRG